jgi:hypothetical protein
MVDTHGIDKVLNEVHGLIEAGFPETAIEAAEHALTLLERAFEQVDDSNGEMRSLAARAQEIHLTACEAAQPDRAGRAADPVGVAQRLGDLLRQRDRLCQGAR